jgi:hypothetical protein
MLASLAYRGFHGKTRAAAFRAGIEVIEVNPAYTSVIGAVNHASRLGISTHLAAAFAIARRGMELREQPVACISDPARPAGLAVVPMRNGAHVTFELPVRNRSKHVWNTWQVIRKRLQAAHVGHSQSGRSKGPPAPMRAFELPSGATWLSRVRPPGANRQHRYQADVDGLEDVPL